MQGKINAAKVLKARRVSYKNILLFWTKDTKAGIEEIKKNMVLAMRKAYLGEATLCLRAPDSRFMEDSVCIYVCMPDFVRRKARK